MSPKPLLASVACAALAACSMAPAYHVPTTPLAETYKAAPGWAQAAPQDAAPKGAWWTLFADPALDALEARVAITNQNVAAARAAYDQARALVRQDRASLLPTAGITGSATHGGNFANAPATTTLTAGASANWQVDLWSQIGNTVKQASAQAQASNAQLANATLSAQGELANDYLQLRGIDAQSAMLSDTIAAYARALVITQNKYAVGTVTPADVDSAQTSLSNAKAQAAELARQRAALEDAIAVLVGENPSTFRIAPVVWAPIVPTVPAALPSQILQRRPDIAAAERAVAAANANIGIQRAAFFPTLSLSASAQSPASTFSSLFGAATSLWSLGATSAVTLLDFGARSAKVAQARAAYEQTVAQYRQSVLAAFQQVEDNLAGLAAYGQEAGHYRTAAEASARAEAIARNEYLAGTVDYTTVTAAQSTAYGARVNLIQNTVNQQSAAVDLIVAIGGHWDDSTP